MVTQNLNQYSREDLENVLIVLKDYRNSLKQIGKRSELSHPKHKQAKFFRVEHTAAISQEFHFRILLTLFNPSLFQYLMLFYVS